MAAFGWLSMSLLQGVAVSQRLVAGGWLQLGPPPDMEANVCQAECCLCFFGGAEPSGCGSVWKVSMGSSVQKGCMDDLFLPHQPQQHALSRLPGWPGRGMLPAQPLTKPGVTHTWTEVVEGPLVNYAQLPIICDSVCRLAHSASGNLGRSRARASV